MNLLIVFLIVFRAILLKDLPFAAQWTSLIVPIPGQISYDVYSVTFLSWDDFVNPTRRKITLTHEAYHAYQWSHPEWWNDLTHYNSDPFARFRVEEAANTNPFIREVRGY